MPGDLTEVPSTTATRETPMLALAAVILDEDQPQDWGVARALASLVLGESERGAPA